MLDQLIGMFMLGLGMKTPTALPGQVRGDSTEVQTQEVETKEVKDGTGFMLEQKNEQLKKAAELKKEALKNIQETKRESFKAVQEKFRETVKTARTQLKEGTKEAREKFENEFKDTLHEATSARELKRGEFQKKLGEMKDAKKKKLVTQTLSKMTNLNAKRTKEMGTALTRMQKVLENVSAKALTLQNSGKDVAAVLEAYGAAQTAVTNASLAVSAQAGKSYDVSTSTSSDVRADVEAGVKSLETDISGIKTQMEAAKQAVYVAVKALSAVK